MIQKHIEIIKAPDSIKPFAIIYKPYGLPSAPLTIDDKENAFCQAAELFPELLQVHGRKEIEHGLLHRLDTATSGLMIIASTQECYDFLMQEQMEGRITKTYFAECNMTTPECKTPVSEYTAGQEYTVSSYFRPFGPGRKEVRPVTQNSGKAALNKLEKPVLYTTKIKILEFDRQKNLAKGEEI